MKRWRLVKWVVLAGVLGTASCDQSKQESEISSGATRSDKFDSLSFTRACNELMRHPELDDFRLQRDRARHTLGVLFARYRTLTGAKVGSLIDSCDDMATAWKGRRLDLSGVGSVSVMLVVKLGGVRELDLSNNSLDDSDFIFLKHYTTSSHHNRIKNELVSLDLSDNNLTGVHEKSWDLRADYPRLQRIDLSNNHLKSLSQLKLPTSTIAVDFSDNPDMSFGDMDPWSDLSDLAYVNVSGIASISKEAIAKLLIPEGALIVGLSSSTEEGSPPSIEASCPQTIQSKVDAWGKLSSVSCPKDMKHSGFDLEGETDFSSRFYHLFPIWQ